MQGHVWDDAERPLVAAMRATAEEYRNRHRLGAVPAEPVELLMPAWSEPMGLTDDEFRATPGASVARAAGVDVVVWLSTTPGPEGEVRRVDLRETAADTIEK